MLDADRAAQLTDQLLKVIVSELPDRMLQPHAREAGFFGAQHGRGR